MSLEDGNNGSNGGDSSGNPLGTFNKIRAIHDLAPKEIDEIDAKIAKLNLEIKKLQLRRTALQDMQAIAVKFDNDIQELNRQANDDTQTL